MHEELFHQNERLEKTGYEKLFFAHSRVCDNAAVERLIAQLHEACLNFNELRVMGLLNELVPEYTHSESLLNNLVFIDEARKKSGSH